jgi:hypothetical protein
MAKRIEVVIEGFGRRSISQSFLADEIRDMDLQGIVQNVLEHSRNQDPVAYNGLMRKVNSASGNYTPQIATHPILKEGSPVSFLPATVRDKVGNYLDKPYVQDDTLRISITPAHKTA